MKDLLRQQIGDALQACFNNNTLHSGVVPEVQIEVPGNPDHGDFASNLAMTMARAEKKSPRQIAEALVSALEDCDFLSKVEIAGPGFINFTLAPACWYEVLDAITEKGADYGLAQAGQGHKVQVEFVSANPTGPLHIGHGRGAVTGDAVASVLQAAGHEVQREYYINDAGNQMRTLGLSLLLRYREMCGEQVDFPGDCYQGDYIVDLAREIHAAEGTRYLDLEEDAAIKALGRFGGDRILVGIREDLEVFGIKMDNWFSEQGLFDRGEVAAGLKLLAEKGLTYEKDGATWFRTTDFGDDKDRVLVRSNGETTYFASDVAYHLEKFGRGFDTVIDVWGADHHGYVQRMKAVISGIGRDPDDLQVILVQLVSLLREGEPVAMSTRSGEFVTLREVVDEVGKDACRFLFLLRRADSPLDFDLELAKRQSNDNPVYYVQYAHARVCSINNNAAEQGIALPKHGAVDLSRLTLAEELALTKHLARYSETIVSAAESHEPHRIVYYLQELAAQFHSYYNRQRVLVEDAATTQARLYLVNSVRTVLANALNLLGVDAPERM
ncbi:MAG: arginine--tRNA ligase [Deltaproteobacteria bacterium]|nr:MAG: arginine--tRNA ligase [Deltaproteobacteria bacterium]